MELPHVGKHCSLKDCSQLDFLPYTCYHCKKIYCQEHFKLDDHNCPIRQDPNFDVRVVTCPVCDKPVPGPRNEDPNDRVYRHIQNNCMDQKAPSNLCKLKGCKAKLLVPMNCNACGLSYCVKHRLEQDHQCVGKNQKSNHSSSSSTAQKMSAMAAIKRSAGLKQSTSTNTNNNKSGMNNNNNRQNNMNRQKIQTLQAKADRGALTEEEQIQLATLLSLEHKNKENKNCIIG
ncbi:unnamed protein product [Cunninghamella blakesleeana]